MTQTTEPVAFRNSKGQIIGNLKDGVFRKSASKKKHYMRVLEAWGTDNDVLSKLRGLGCTEVRIMDTDTKNVWSTSFATFYEKGYAKVFGHGTQVFLHKRFWTIKNGEKIIQTCEPTEEDRKSKQQSLQV